MASMRRLSEEHEGEIWQASETQNAVIGEGLNVELASPRHLYWPDLDVDLAVESIPERFPLVSKQRPHRPARQQQKNGERERPKFLYAK